VCYCEISYLEAIVIPFPRYGKKDKATITQIESTTTTSDRSSHLVVLVKYCKYLILFMDFCIYGRSAGLLNMLNVYNQRHKIGCVVFGVYSLLSVAALIAIVSMFYTSTDDDFFKDAFAHSITIPVRGLAPFGIAYNPVNNNMYVTNYLSSTVSVISSSSDSVIASILVGRNPTSIVYAPPNNKLYVTNAGSADVYVINGATNKVIKNIPVDDSPVGTSYNPSNNDVYVVGNANNTVSVLDTSTDSVIDTIRLDSVLPPPSFLNPVFLAYDRTNGGMYVGAQPQVSVINTATNTDIKDTRMPTPFADSQAAQLVHYINNDRIYVTAHDDDMVVRMNPETNDFEGSAIPVGSRPIGIIHNPNNNNIYVANSGSNTVSIINPITNTVVGSIPTGLTPFGIAHNPTNSHIYITNAGSNTVSIIHP
jgi:YVTN family beta-propeller protein